jgi:hypothetical protein
MEEEESAATTKSEEYRYLPVIGLLHQVLVTRRLAPLSTRGKLLAVAQRNLSTKKPQSREAKSYQRQIN